MSRRVRMLCALAALLLGSRLGVNSLQAQATASISGTITDTSGAAVSESVVKATNTGTGIVRSTVSDPQGRFRIPDLAIGDYDVEALKPGFQTVLHKGVTLTVGSNPVVDAALPIGQTQQTVDVTAEVSQVETESSAITNLVGQTEMRELPLNGRNYTQLLLLEPGVVSFAPSGNQLFGSQQSFSVSGQRTVGQLFLLDGTNTTGYFDRGPGSGALGTALGVDAIDQFQTLTNTYSAEYGGNGVVINASTKSGTNSYHGSVYEFLRNSAIESRNYFDGAKVPAYRQNQFGTSLGGPIKKDKMFFFVNYEGFRAAKTVSNIATVPDAQAHNFLMPNASGVYVPVPQSSNPITAAAVQGVLALYPTATTEIFKSGLPTGTGFVTLPNKTDSYENYLIGRFDYNISPKDSFFFRYVLDRASRQANAVLNLDPELDLTRNNYATVEERRIISSNLVNLARFSYVRVNESGSFPAVTPALQLYPGEGRPNGSFSPGSSVTTLAPSGPPFYVVPNNYTVGDDLIWTHGAHSIKTGASIERLQENAWNPGNLFGTWTFANLTNFLQGIPTQVTGALSDVQYPGQDAHKDWRELHYGIYAQDDWKVSSRLTLNIGLRYEPTENSSFARHYTTALLNAPYGNWVNVTNVHATNISLKNWDPRVGLAWDPFRDHKTSIRAGFGIFHYIIQANETPMYQQPPYIQGSQTLAQGATFPIMFSNIPAGSGTIPTNGSLACNVCSYYGQTRTPTTYQENLTFQREIAPSTVFTLGLLASHANFLQISHDFNYAVPVVGPDGNQVFGSLVNGNIVLNPRLNPTWNTIKLQNGQASSHYWAMQANVNHRLAKGLQGQLSFTWSKSMDDGSAGIGGYGDNGFTNPTNMRADYGLSGFDRRRTLTASVVYMLPFHMSNGFINAAVSGWQVSGVVSSLSGLPFSPSVGFASTGTGGYTPRPNVTAGCDMYPQQQTLSNWFNTSCFTAPPIGEFGNAGRNTLTGPGLFNMDSSLSKEARVAKFGEQFIVQFRAEFFNITNHPSFAVPNSNLWVQGTNGAFNPNPSVNLITSTVSQPRQIQFGLKVLF